MSSSPSVTSQLTTLLTTHFPSPTMDSALTEYFSSIFIDQILPNYKSTTPNNPSSTLLTRVTNALIESIGELLESYELTDSPVKTKEVCQKMANWMIQHNLVSGKGDKPKEVKESKESKESKMGDNSTKLATSGNDTTKGSKTTSKSGNLDHKMEKLSVSNSNSIAAAAASGTKGNVKSSTAGNTATAAASSTNTPLYSIGTRIQARYIQDNQFYSAWIRQYNVKSQLYQVEYCDYQGELEWVKEMDIRSENDGEENEDENEDEDEDGSNSSSSSSGVSQKLLNRPIRLMDSMVDNNTNNKTKSTKDQDKEKEVSARMAKLNKKLAKKEEEKIRIDAEKKRWNARAVYDPRKGFQVYLQSIQAIQQQKIPRNQLNRDIHLVDFQLLSPDNTELIAPCEVTIVSGRRYGLIAPNGRGKTTLLRQLASYDIKGFPTYLRVAYVEQELEGSPLSVLDTVLTSDLEREMLLQEEKQLMDEDKETSGNNANNNGKSNNAERLQAIYDRLQSIESWSAESRAVAILNGLGFTPEMQRGPTAALSGGWRMRVALASALFLAPDLLLLDEPTNHLDLSSVAWLQNYLTTDFHGTLLVVSHDRTFLNEVSTDVIHLNNKKRLDTYRGNYEQFLKIKQERYLHAKRAYEAQQMRRAHIQDFIDTYYTEKKSAKQNAKIGQVESRQKVLDKMELIEDPDQELSEISSRFDLKFPDPMPLRVPLMVELKNVAFKYDTVKGATAASAQSQGQDQEASDRPFLFQGINGQVDITSRIGILGRNGCGKSTLIKLILDQYKPQIGSIHVNPNMTVAVFTQHHVDLLNLGLTPVEQLLQFFPTTTEVEVRKVLGRFGLPGEWANIQIGNLSGGQKSRLSFAILTWKQPNLIILDEPTNHLDVPSQDELISAVNSFPGAVMAISHDQYFLSRTMKSFWAFGNNTMKICGSIEECKNFSYK